MAFAMGSVGCGSTGSSHQAQSSPKANASPSGASAQPSSIASAKSSASPTKFVIPVITDMTGKASSAGKESSEALKAYQTIVNQQGGINGTPVSFKIYDAESSPKVAVQLASRLKAQHYPVILGPNLTATASAVVPLSTNGPVFYGMTPGLTPKAHSFYFAAGLPTAAQMQATLQFFQNQGWTRVAALTSTDSSGTAGLAALKKALAAQNTSHLQLVASQQYDDSADSVSAQMTNIQAAHPQMLVFWSPPGGAAQVGYRGIQQAALHIPVITSEGDVISSEMKSFAAFLPKQLYSAEPIFYGITQKDLNSLGAGQRQAISSFLSAFPHIIPDTGHAFAWDPAHIVVAALKKTGVHATPKQIRETIEQMSQFNGAMGSYHFTPQNHFGTGVGNVYIDRWDSTTGRWVRASGSGGSKE